MYITMITNDSNIDFIRQFASVEVLLKTVLKPYMLCSDIRDKVYGIGWNNPVEDLTFFILEFRNYDEHQYVLDVMTLNSALYFYDGIVYENLNDCVRNIDGESEVYLDFGMLDRVKLFEFVESLYKIAGNGAKLSPNLSLLLCEYYSDILAFKRDHIGAYTTLCSDINYVWKFWVHFGYASKKRIRDIERTLCESDDTRHLSSYCANINQVPDTFLSMVATKHGINSVQYQKLIEIKGKL